MQRIKLRKRTQYCFLVVCLFAATLVSFPPLSPDKTGSITNPHSYVLDYLHDTQYDKSDYYIYNESVITKSSGFITYRVFIDEKDDLYDWNWWVTNYPWCTGNGTFSNPYIIEKLYIDAQGTGGAICIKNTKKYFIIRNCWLYNGGGYEYWDGIYLQHTGNGTVVNNVVINFDIGINTDFGNEHNISNNIIISDGRWGSRGIKQEWGDNNIFSDNKILNPQDNAIYLYQGDNLTIDGNYMENTKTHYIYPPKVIRLVNCTNSDITHNVMAGLYKNATISVMQWSPHNVVENNYISHDQSLKFNFSKVKLSNGPLMSQNESNTIEMTDCHGNYIAYNIVLITEPIEEDSPDESTGGNSIGGYESVLIITIIGIVVFIISRRKMHH